MDSSLAILIILLILSTVTPFITYKIYEHCKMPVFVVNTPELTDYGNSVYVRLTIIRGKKLKSVRDMYLFDKSSGKRFDISGFSELYCMDTKTWSLTPGYFLVKNPAKIIRPGNKIKIVIGPYQSDEVTVRPEIKAESPWLSTT